MGTYDLVDPSPAMVDALVTLLAWKCARWGIDPLGRGPFAASNGVAENLFNICGHRDTSATDCPGQRVEPMLPALRAKVAARLTGAGYWIATNLGQVLAFGGAPLAVATGVPAHEPDRRDRRAPERNGLLAVRGRRQRLRVRQRAVPRWRCTASGSRRRSSACRRRRRATVTGSSPATAASSPSATRASSARPARCGSTRRCSA